VTEIWQVYLLIFLLQSASAAFTPTVQALIPDILTDEAAYTRALSASRLAYDLEAVASPALAAALLSVTGFHALFGGTALGFLVSAGLIAGLALPAFRVAGPRPPLGRRSLDGLHIILATPRLRALAAIDLALAAAGAMVIVNTVVIVQGRFGLDESRTALLLAINGAGSMLAALTLPRLLDRLPERRVMLTGTALLAPCLLAGIGICPDAGGPAPPPVGSPRGPPGPVRGAVRGLPCLLAACLSAGRLGRCGPRHGCGIRDDGRDRRHRRHRGHAVLAQP
jgi:MFS family permease